MQIVVVPPRSHWATDFASLKLALLQAVPPNSCIHHIGSTAVPGLAAKDIIDIQVTVDDLTKVEDVAFETAGFRSSRISEDHCPARLDLPASELRKRLYLGQNRAAKIVSPGVV
jgi:GrpB-like predicted nucleotidyltransferase (UPF0157 family)